MGNEPMKKTELLELKNGADHLEGLLSLGGGMCHF